MLLFSHLLVHHSCTDLNISTSRMDRRMDCQEIVLTLMTQRLSSEPLMLLLK